jgi:Recombinase
MRGNGLTLREIAGRLAAEGIRTARGGQWTAMAVKNVLDRAA